jgi:hypothetical protein
MLERHADRAVRLVDLADRGEAGIGLGDARAVDEAGLAGVAGAGVDLVEADQRMGLIFVVAMLGAKNRCPLLRASL